MGRLRHMDLGHRAWAPTSWSFLKMTAIQCPRPSLPPAPPPPSRAWPEGQDHGRRHNSMLAAPGVCGPVTENGIPWHELGEQPSALWERWRLGWERGRCYLLLFC